MSAFFAWFTATHVLQALTIYATVNALVGPLVAKVPEVTTGQKILHTVCAFGPADVTKVIKVWGDIGKALTLPLTAVLALVAFGSVSACGGSSVAAKVAPQADVAAYAAEQKACVDVAQTKAEADACIAEVKAQYCGDGGSLHAAGGC